MAATSQLSIEKALAQRDSSPLYPSQSATPYNSIPPIIHELLHYVRANGDADCRLHEGPPCPVLYFPIRVRDLPEQLRTDRVLWDAMDRGLIHIGSWHAELAPQVTRHVKFGIFIDGTRFCLKRAV